MKKQKQHKKKKQKQHKKKKQELSRAQLVSDHEVQACETSPILLWDVEGIVPEILSRLPVKSLMRFKCVCKHWQSVIQKDHFFIDLHYSLSKISNRVSLVRIGKLMNHGNSYLISMELLLPSDDEEEKGCVSSGVGAMPERKYHSIPIKKGIFCTTNGLICAMDQSKRRVCIYNISTRESTPWIRSTVSKHAAFSLNRFGLGYDPVAKEHKVISVWNYTATKNLVCEVLTIGRNFWRRIDAVVPHLSGKCHYDGIVESVHVNGFICWLQFEYHYFGDPCIIQFDVASEKFKQINILLSYPIYGIFLCPPSLVNINGRLAMLVVRESSTKLYTLLLDKNTATSTTFSKPPADCNPRWDKNRHIPGTDLFMVRCRDDDLFYYYNWKEKSYSSRMINLKTPSSCRDIWDVVFTPNLFPVN
ncbi:hypothetical protein MKW92_023260 [Papaver armeniacum]|nr:hypothetical protein MKW92_023260 [Papaver armeniacum]